MYYLRNTATFSPDFDNTVSLVLGWEGQFLDPDLKKNVKMDVF